MSKFKTYLKSEHYKNLNKLHPHIIERIKLLWGRPEARIYLNNLLLETRDGARMGFQAPASKAIMFFLNEHDTHFPQYVEESQDPWDYFTN